MIYETAWHEEDQTGYADTNCYGDWLSPDTSWDGVNTWALRLQNHVRQAGFYAAAAAWARDVRLGTQSPAVQTQAVDLDFDGEVEYLIRNDRVWAVFERYGGRCVLAAAYDPARQDGDVVIGAPYTNPSAPGEEEYATAAANRCSAFKEMNGGGLADAVYSVVAVTDGWRFTSPGGEVVKTMTLQAGGATLLAQYVEGVGGPLFVRLGLSPNPLDLALHGHAHLHGQFRATENVYILANTAGGVARLDCGSATFSPTPVNAGWDRRNLALTEEIEVHGDNSFTLALELRAGSPATSSAVSPASRRLEVSGPWPSPAGGDAVVRVHLAAAVVVQLEIHDVAGRRIAHREFGSRNAGAHDLAVTSRDASGRNLPSGVYWVRVRAGDRVATRRWTVVRP
jgi:hypothetical protein